MVFALVACGDGPSTETAGTDTSSQTVSSSDTASSETASSETASSETASSETVTDTEGGDASSDTVDEPVTPVKFPNLVMANDQMKNRLVIFDFDKYEEGDTLEDLEVWSVNSGHAAGLKYREDTVFGDVVLVGGSHSAIYEYPSGKEIWGTDNPGNNTHSIEILPSGNVIIANSTGGDVRLFRTSALLTGDTARASTYVSVPLSGAHGVLWDPEYEMLWGLGGGELVAFEVRGEGVNQKLVKINGVGGTLPEEKSSGHDLSPDYLDSQFLYITVDSCVMKFDKEENEFVTEFENFETLTGKYIKGLSNNPNGNFFEPGPAGGEGTSWKDWSKASWCTDRIYYFTANEDGTLTRTEIVSNENAFYKVRAFCGQYQ